MNKITIIFAAAILCACGTPPKTAARSSCRSDPGTQVIVQPNGDVLITGDTICKNMNSPFEGLPVKGAVYAIDYSIESKPDDLYQKIVCSMPAGSNSTACATRRAAAGY